MFSSTTVLLMGSVQAAMEPIEASLDLTHQWAGYFALVVFVAAYGTVILEEKLHLRKSIPVMIAAGLIWAAIGAAYVQAGDLTGAGASLRESLGDFAELFLFILAAMTFVNTMEERQVFDALRAWLVRQGLSYRQLFWATGAMSFFFSSQLDNLTTALVMGTVCITVGRGQPKFIALACINTVVAANAGGAWSAFGDITTLMVWQSGHVAFFDFYRLIIPSLVNWIIPAVFMSLAVPRGTPSAVEEKVIIRRGGLQVVGLFAVTIVLAVTSYNGLKLPPVIGMTTGLALLKLYSFYLHKTSTDSSRAALAGDVEPLGGIEPATHDSFDIFDILRRSEWDTLMFFFGIIVSVGGLAKIGYLESLSRLLYEDFGAFPANVAIDLISAVVDNIPVMFAVLSMDPPMNLSEWLLVTLTAGVGGSLLSVGSAAGVALMGQAKGAYTFFSHLKWTWAIALGYAASIYLHIVLDRM